MKLLLKTNGIYDSANNLSDLKLLGFLEVLKRLNPNEVYSMASLCEKYAIKSDELKHLLLLLKNYNIIEYSVDTQDESLTINIYFDFKINTSNNNYASVFGIEKQIHESIVKKCTSNSIVDEEQLKLNVLLLVKNNMYKKSIFNGIIETKEQLINYLKKVCVQELFEEHQVYFSNKDAQIIYESITDFDFNCEVVNIIVDYTLKTTKNSNFNHNFYLKVAQNFFKNKIASIEQGLEHIKKFKDNSNSDKFGYKEPIFEKPEEIEINPDFDLEELIENAYN